MDKNQHLLRFMEEVVRNEIKSNPAVVLVGPRQSGKTTLVKKFMQEGYEYFSLNDSPTLDMVNTDLKGMLLSHPKIIIDEHQRRDLSQGLISIIDERREKSIGKANGMIILTGSFTQSGFDSLAGRIAELKLLPLAQAELHQCKLPSFLERTFNGKCPQPADEFDEGNFIDALLQGGYPLLQSKTEPRAKAAWLRHYFRKVKELDIPSLKPYQADLPNKNLLAMLASHVGSEINKASVSKKLGIGLVKLASIVNVLEDLHLIKHLTPIDQLKAGNKKLHFIDTGIYAQVTKLTKKKIGRNRNLLGPLLETFIYGELAKHCDWANEGHELSYFRERDPSNTEVDFVIEDQAGRRVGIEVKAALEVRKEDLRGLQAMKRKFGEEMIMGLVISLGKSRIIDTKNNFHVVNVSALWADYDKPANLGLFD